MTRRPLQLLISLVGVALALQTVATTPQAAPADWQACARHAAQAERDSGIPANLLSAVSLVESGRWDESRGATTAWPWTINAEGDGYFLPTKAAAMAKVRDLQAAGVRSIDVGCMQVNLVHHGQAFASLEEAFDPAANAAYAADFLSRLRADTGSWSAAAGRYHSATPRFGLPYRDKVVRTWNDLNHGPRPRIATAGPSTYRTAAIDHDRTAWLNDRFRATRKQQAATAGPQKRRRQLDDWRSLADRQPFTVLAAVQAARLDRKRRDQARVTPETRQQDFAAKRRKQLDDWRRRVAGNP